jgi:nicotinamide-nucleotide adenylyltransferase
MNRGEIADAMRRAGRPGPPRLEVLGPSPASPATVGLVAGSFDPMTVAHAALAETLGTALVLLVWSPATLPKEAGPGGAPAAPLLEPEDRVASLLAYAAARTSVAVALCSHGLYADQAEAAAAAFPRARPVLGLGSDKLRQLFDPGWYRDRDAALRRLFALADVAYAVRAGDEAAVRDLLARERPWRPRLRRLELDPVVAGVSSRSVRRAVHRGDDVTALVPEAIQPYVRAASRRGPSGA